MSKLIGWACAVMFLFPFLQPQSDKFLKYRAVETYEVRPGILMMPRYSADGQVCEIGLQRRLYSPEKVRLDAGLSREEIDELLEELAPADERGPRAKDFDGTLITQGGHTITTSIDFERVSIQLFAKELSAPGRGEITGGNVVATVHWKNRKCQ